MSFLLLTAASRIFYTVVLPPLSNNQTHYDVCREGLIACPIGSTVLSLSPLSKSACRSVFKRKHWDEHMNSCASYLLPCQRCDKVCTRQDYRVHMLVRFTCVLIYLSVLSFMISNVDMACCRLVVHFLWARFPSDFVCRHPHYVHIINTS